MSIGCLRGASPCRTWRILSTSSPRSGAEGVAGPERIVIVGASLAGLNAAESLRAEGFAGSLTMIGAERRLPYDRPPLSKQILAGEWEPERADLRTEDEYAMLELDWRLGVRATALDLDSSELELSDGTAAGFDRLLIATGAAPKRLPNDAGLAGVYTLRSLDDCLALRAEFARGPRVVVVGAGFIGLEIAAVARGRGLEVTVVEMESTPLAQVLGARMGALIGALHRDQGVELRMGVALSGIEGGDRVERLLLSDGSNVEADLVVIGIGVSPETDWLEGSGLSLDDGVVCDEFCEAALASGSGVFAAGDVARWYNPRLAARMRVEHWTNAVEQGMAVAPNMLAEQQSDRVAYQPVPSFWSDQYDQTIMHAGWSGPNDDWRIVHGEPGERRLVALAGRAGRLVGVLAFNWPRRYREYETLIADGASLDDALRKAGELNA